YEVGESSSAAAARQAGCFRANYGFVAAVDREIMHDPEREVGYGITDSWNEIVETLQGALDSTDTEFGGYEIYGDFRVEDNLAGADHSPTGKVTGDSLAGVGPEHVDDEIVAEDHRYVEDASPTAQSPEYVPESDFEAHPEDDDD
nr:hypothetical protein [Tanacetum cinerariifolium]